MIDLFRIVLPYVLLFYFVVKGIKSPLFLLGIPFLMFMRESIFFMNIKLFTIPGKLGLILGFIWLVLFWILFSVIRIYKKPDKLYNTKQLNALDYFVIGLMILTGIGLGSAIINNSLLTGVFKEFINLFSLFAGFFIVKNWASYNEPEVLEKFLLSLVIINSITAFLFILHQGLHFKIYLQAEYLKEIFNGQEVTRTMWFMPQFLFLAITFSLIYMKKNPLLYSVLLTLNLIATIITYFRSFSIIAVCLFIVYSILMGLKKGKLLLVLRNVFLYCLLGCIFFLVISKVFPTNTEYILNRFSEITDPQSAKESNNLDVRFMMSRNVITNIEGNKLVLGMGAVTENQTYWAFLMKQALADMVWTGVIFRWGLVGTILFILLFIFSLFKAFNLFMKSEGVVSDLALLVILYLFSQIIESFIDWIFMSEHGYSIGLWYFAILSLILGYKKNEISQDRV
jgi:hypothetical protein